MSRSAVFVAFFATVLAGCASTDVGSSTTAEPSPTTTTTAATPTSTRDQGSPQQSDTIEAFDASYLSLGPGAAFPALDDPPMVAGSDAGWLEADDIVLGLVNAGEAQAFPASQLAYHHIVNTTIGGEPYLVTY